jgi:hypothetical protein
VPLQARYGLTASHSDLQKVGPAANIFCRIRFFSDTWNGSSFPLTVQRASEYHFLTPPRRVRSGLQGGLTAPPSFCDISATVSGFHPNVLVRVDA